MVLSMQAEIQLRRKPDPRRESRHFAHRDGEIEPVGASCVPGVVTDLSRSGFRIVVDEPLAPEAVVWLKVGEHGPFMARVVWYDGAAAGCEFAGQLHPDVVAALLEG
jgi:hypothetical protein